MRGGGRAWRGSCVAGVVRGGGRAWRDGAWRDGACPGGMHARGGGVVM